MLEPHILIVMTTHFGIQKLKSLKLWTQMNPPLKTKELEVEQGALTRNGSKGNK